MIYVGSGPDLDLHMSCGKESPARPNQFESSFSSIMETQSTALHHSLIYETWLLWIRDGIKGVEMINEVIELD